VDSLHPADSFFEEVYRDQGGASHDEAALA